MSRLLGDIGTIDWCRRTHGLMTTAERMRFMTAIVLETTRAAPRLLLARAGVWKQGPDPSSLALPDTVFTRAVIAACAHLEPMMLEHSLRSYLFARGLAVLEGESVDDEALFAATMLHDLAFPKLEDPADDRCFGLRGAEQAEAVLQGSTLSRSLQHDVLDAITLHLNPYVSAEQGALQRLTHDGVMLDVVGARAWELDRNGIARVFERHPRHALSRHGPRYFRAHAARLPRSRAGAMVKCGVSIAMRLGSFLEPDAHALRFALHTPATTASNAARRAHTAQREE